MKIGIRIPAAGPRAATENIVTAARWAEALGFHSIWVSDHVVLPERVDSAYPYDPAGRWPYAADTPWLDPLLALGFAASAAPSVALGTSVLVAPLRHPVLLAKQVSTLDFLSGGRVILGLGAGWMEEEFGLVGAPFARRGARALEMVALMRALWTGDSVDFAGEFYRAQGCRMHPRPVQARIPVLWGGHSEAALRRVVQSGDGWHPTQLDLDRLAEGVARLRALCAEHGRDFGTVSVIARPSGVYALDRRAHERHVELGIDHVVIDPPLDGPDLSRFRAELERVATLCSLTPRAHDQGTEQRRQA
ncbi:MAG TPA: LLM class F420-dependent oxidoreductase [Haliangium sp.]|nr:LLM class F420-dependent oxidoreductase [Haliangium sp.]